MKYRFNERKKFLCTHCIFNENANKLDNYVRCIYTHSPAKKNCENFQPINRIKENKKDPDLILFVLSMFMIGLSLLFNLFALFVIAAPIIFYLLVISIFG
jgi:hypothetical protein